MGWNCRDTVIHLECWCCKNTYKIAVYEIVRCNIFLTCSDHLVKLHLLLCSIGGETVVVTVKAELYFDYFQE